MPENTSRFYRDLCQITEADPQEIKLRDYLTEVLKQHPCRLSEIAATGLAAYFRAGDSNCRHTVAFRSEMKGHEGHMAMLLGLAREIALMGPTLPINVLLLFQPVEGDINGAKRIAATGILKQYDVERIFSLHLTPSEIKGAIMGRPLEMMAKTGDLEITVHGKGTPFSTYEKGIDSLLAGCVLLQRLYKMEKSCLPTDSFRLLKFSRMESKGSPDTIAEKTVLHGTLRSYSEKDFSALLYGIRQTVEQIQEEHSCKIDVACSEIHPAVLNDEDLFEMAREALGSDGRALRFVTLRKPILASDDFSYYLQKVPGLYLLLGTGEEAPFSPKAFTFDESILDTGVSAYLHLLRVPLVPLRR